MELPDDDRPPERIWLDDEAITAHFTALRERYSGKGGSTWESVPDVQTIENDLAAQFRRG